MAEITNPQVVTFSNEQVRPIADQFYKLYYKALSVNQNYNANDIGSAINAAGAGELITDGSQVDGRTRITGGDIYNLMTAIGQFIAYMEGSAVTTADRRSVITKPHVQDAV